MTKLLAESRVVLTLDGEQFQMEAVEVLRQLPKNERVEFFKFAAQCTPCQQPLDKCPSFRIFKRSVKGNTGVKITVGTYEPPYMRRVHQILASVDSRSRRTFTKFFRTLRDYVHHAFQPRHIVGAFSETGLIPYDPLKIIRHWPHFGLLSDEQGHAVMSAISTLSERCRSTGAGYILNSAIAEQLQAILPAEMMPSADDHIYSLQTNRWNAAWLNNPTTVERISVQNNELERRRKLRSSKGGNRKRSAPVSAVSTDGTGAATSSTTAIASEQPAGARTGAGPRATPARAPTTSQGPSAVSTSSGNSGSNSHREVERTAAPPYSTTSQDRARRSARGSKNQMEEPADEGETVKRVRFG